MNLRGALQRFPSSKSGTLLIDPRELEILAMEIGTSPLPQKRHWNEASDPLHWRVWSKELQPANYQREPSREPVFPDAEVLFGRPSVST